MEAAIVENMIRTHVFMRAYMHMQVSNSHSAYFVFVHTCVSVSEAFGLLHLFAFS